MFLYLHVRNRKPLLPRQCGIRVELLAKRTLDCRRLGVLALDLVRVVRVHGPQLRGKRAHHRLPGLTPKSMAFRHELGGQFAQWPQHSVLREKGLKSTYVCHLFGQLFGHDKGQFIVKSLY